MNKVGRDGVDDDGDGAVEKWGADGARNDDDGDNGYGRWLREGS